MLQVSTSYYGFAMNNAVARSSCPKTVEAPRSPRHRRCEVWHTPINFTNTIPQNQYLRARNQIFFVDSSRFIIRSSMSQKNDERCLLRIKSSRSQPYIDAGLQRMLNFRQYDEWSYIFLFFFSNER